MNASGPLVFVVLALLSPLNAQSTFAPAPPAAAPELQRLAYFVGEWKTNGHLVLGTASGGSPFTSTDHMEWMEGGRFVLGHASSVLAGSSRFQLSVLGYDADRHEYTFQSYSSSGVATSATGSVDGTTWTWIGSATIGGRAMQLRHTITATSATAYAFRFDTSSDGKSWAPYMEGTTTKVP